MNVDFSHALSKLQRAQHHIDELNAFIDGYSSPNFYRILRETDNQSQQLRLRFESLHPKDEVFSLIVGDAIGCLRSSLDYIAVAVLAAAGHKTPEAASFPFQDSHSEVVASVQGGMIGSVLIHALEDAFIYKLQPYKGGIGHDLWVLNKLRNIDKHRLLVTTLNMARITVNASWGGMHFSNAIFGVEEGEDSVLLQAPANTKIQFYSDPKPTLAVFLYEPSISERLDAVKFLNSLCGKIEAVMQLLQVVIGSSAD